MKFSVVTVCLPALLGFALLWPQAPLSAQATPPQAPPAAVVPPGAPGPIPAAPKAVPPDTVVMEVDGKKYTAAEVDQMIASMPVQYQPQIRSNPKFLTQLFVFREMEHMAIAEKLDQQSPYKEQLQFARMQYLATMASNNFRTRLKVSEDEEQKYYQVHSGDTFRAAKARVIYLAFRPPNAQTDEAKKKPTEAEAKAKADDLRKQLQAGADFGALAKANSDDKGSAERGGDYGLITQTSSSDAMKKVVFALKVGEISEPVRQPNGFYLVRVDEFVTQPFDQVQAAIDEYIRSDKFREWNLELQKRYDVKVDEPAYFQPRPMPAGLPPQAAPSRPVVPGVSK